MCCSVLQYVAVYYKCGAVWCSTLTVKPVSRMKSVAERYMCCSVLQCVTRLKCVAENYKCGAVWCSMA